MWGNWVKFVWNSGKTSPLTVRTDNLLYKHGVYSTVDEVIDNQDLNQFFPEDKTPTKVILSVKKGSIYDRFYNILQDTQNKNVSLYDLHRSFSKTVVNENNTSSLNC